MTHSIRLARPQPQLQQAWGGPSHKRLEVTNPDIDQADLASSKQCPSVGCLTWMAGASALGVAGGLGFASSAASASETVVQSVSQGLLTSQGVVALAAVTAMALGALGIHLHQQNLAKLDRDYLRDLEKKRSEKDERLRAEGYVVERRPGSGICIVRRP